MGLEALYFSGVAGLMHAYGGGAGVILAAHHVRPPRRGGFQPNRHLEIDPRFLERLIVRLRRADYDLVALDDVSRRLNAPKRANRFVCFTLDGGYRDQAEHAWPIFKKFDVPFTQFVVTSFADRLGLLWWRVIESVIAENDQIVLLADGREQRLDCRSKREKQKLFNALVRWLRQRDTDSEIQAFVRDLARRYHVECDDICAHWCLPWDAIAEIARDPLATIGAQSVNYPMLAKLPEHKVAAELSMSRAVIESAVGIRPQHFCYPFGQRDAAGPREFRIARELGYRTGLTARFGVLYREHASNLHALPRVPLGGGFQKPRYVRAMSSGVPSMLWNRFKRLDVG